VVHFETLDTSLYNLPSANHTNIISTAKAALMIHQPPAWN